MTSLVYRDGILAAETQITYVSLAMPGKARKVHKLPGGSLYGFVGSLEVGAIMRRCLISPDPAGHPDLKGESYEGIVLTDTGSTFRSSGKRAGILRATEVEEKEAEACYINPTTGEKSCG